MTTSPDRGQEHKASIPLAFTMPEIHKPRRRVWLVLCAGAVLLLLVLGHGVFSAPSLKLSTLSTSIVQQGDVSLTVRGQGKLIPSEVISVSTGTGGMLQQLHVRRGANVNRGDIIASLSNPELLQKFRDAQKALAQFHATTSSASFARKQSILNAYARRADARDTAKVNKLELKAKEKLKALGITSAIEVEKARVELNSAQRKIAAATTEISELLNDQTVQKRKDSIVSKALSDDELALKSQVDDLTLRSPVTGTVYDLAEHLNVGAQIQPGTSVVQIARTGDADAELSVPSSESGRITIGSPSVIDLNGEKIKGSVKRIDPQVIRDEITVTITLQAGKVVGPLTGQPVVGEIEVKRLKNAVYVPRTENIRGAGSYYIYVLSTQRDSLQRRKAVISETDWKKAIVASGLSAGDVVVTGDLGELDSRSKIDLRQ